MARMVGWIQVIIVILGYSHQVTSQVGPGPGIEVLSHICKYGIHADGRRERMECWAALSYCKRDIKRGPINPREPREIQSFGVLEYRQERRACSLNEFFQYRCVEKERYQEGAHQPQGAK